MTGRRDEVEESVNAVVAEARVTLDPALLGEDVVVLPLEVAHDLVEAEEIVIVSFECVSDSRREHT